MATSYERDQRVVVRQPLGGHRVAIVLKDEGGDHLRVSYLPSGKEATIDRRRVRPATGTLEPTVRSATWADAPGSEGTEARRAPAPAMVPAPLPPRRPLVAQPKKPAVRARDHLAMVAALPCCSCLRPGPSHAHHFGPRGGLNVKCSDYETAPLCAECHSAIHTTGTLPNMERGDALLTLHRAALQVCGLRLAGIDQGTATP